MFSRQDIGLYAENLLIRDPAPCSVFACYATSSEYRPTSARDAPHKGDRR